MTCWMGGSGRGSAARRWSLTAGWTSSRRSVFVTAILALLIERAGSNCSSNSKGSSCTGGVGVTGRTTGQQQLASFTVRQLLNDEVPKNLNPCLPQQVNRWEDYILGVILWAGAHIDQALGDGSAINPCHDDDFTAILAADGATVDVYGVKVDDFTILRGYPSLIQPGAKLLDVVTGSSFPLLISFLFSNEFVSTPFVAASVNSNFSVAEGVVQEQTVVLSTDLDTFSVTPYTMYQSSCPRCSFNYSAYFVDQNISVPLEVDQTSFNFNCINGYQCAWGIGFCRYCIRGLEQSEVRTSHDWFDEAFVRGGLNSTNLQRYNACITFCHTFHYLMWFGADFTGRMLRSEDVYRNHLSRQPLAAFGAFPETFAIGERLWEAIQTNAYLNIK